MKIFVIALAMLFCGNLYSEQSLKVLDKAKEMRDENKIYQEEQKLEKEFEQLQEKAENVQIRKDRQFELDSAGAKNLSSFYISEIILLGDFLGSLEVENILNESKGTMVNIVDVQNIIKKLTNYYIKMGYFTTRVQLKVGQDMSKGKLFLSVFSGKIKEFNYRDSNWWCRSQIFMVFPFMKGDRPNINRIDAGLEVLNRLSSNQFVMKVVPGDSFGWSNVLLDNKKGDFLRLNYSVDDKGSENTGKYTHSFFLEMDNLLFLSDNWNYSYSENLGYKGFKNKKSHSVNGSIPFGTFMFQGGYSFSRYLMTIEGESLDYQTSGNSQTQNYGLNKELFRSKFRKLILGANLTVSDEGNYLEDTKLFTSSFRSAGMHSTITYSDLFFGSPISSTFSYHRGLDWFGAKEDTSGLSKEDPKAEFEKYKFSFFWSKRLKFGINASIFASGQYTDMELYAGEIFSGGGVSDVKGFSLRSSISHRYKNFLYKSRWLPIISPTFSFEYGHVQSRTNSVKEDGGSLTMSMGLIWEMITFRTDYQKPLFLPGKGGLADHCTFSLNFAFNDFYHLGQGLLSKEKKPRQHTKRIKGEEAVLDALELDLGLDKLDLYSGNMGKYLLVANQESLVLYAKWLDVSLDRLKQINAGVSEEDVIYCSQKIYLPQKANFEKFLEYRIEYLSELEKKFWKSRKLVRLASYTIKDKAQLWNLAREDFDLPFWLLQRYNRGINLKDVKSGQKLVVPIVEIK